MSEEILASKIAYIYTLSDPREIDAVRYVGITINPHKRLKEHMAMTVKARSHNGHWLAALKSAGLQAICRIIEIVPLPLADEKERYWIAAYRAQGAELTNATTGGGQMFSFPPDVIAKMIANSKPARDAFMATLTQEQRSERMKHCWTPNASEKRRKSVAVGVKKQWAKRTPEQRDLVVKKISTGVKAFFQNCTPEERVALGRSAAIGRKVRVSQMTSEQLQESRRRNRIRGEKAYQTRLERYGEEELSRRRLEGMYRVPPEERSRKVSDGIAAHVAALTPERKAQRLSRLRQTAEIARSARDAAIARLTPEEVDERRQVIVSKIKSSWNQWREGLTDEEWKEHQRKSHQKRLATIAKRSMSNMTVTQRTLDYWCEAEAA